MTKIPYISLTNTDRKMIYLKATNVLSIAPYEDETETVCKVTVNHSTHFVLETAERVLELIEEALNS